MLQNHQIFLFPVKPQHQIKGFNVAKVAITLSSVSKSLAGRETTSVKLLGKASSVPASAKVVPVATLRQLHSTAGTPEVPRHVCRRHCWHLLLATLATMRDLSATVLSFQPLVQSFSSRCSHSTSLTAGVIAFVQPFCSSHKMSLILALLAYDS